MAVIQDAMSNDIRLSRYNAGSVLYVTGCVGTCVALLVPDLLGEPQWLVWDRAHKWRRPTEEEAAWIKMVAFPEIPTGLQA